MVRERVKWFLGMAGRSRLGRNVVHAAVIGDPRDLRFSSARWWPERIEGFEDLVFLFSSNQLNHGIISQELDEAALIYRLACRVRDGVIVEIGRYKGGSTFLIAAALGEGSELWSYDIHVSHDAPFTGADLDAELKAALARYGLSGRVHLVVADSRAADVPPRPVDVLLVDGDHSYDGVSSDWKHWRSRLAPGAHVLFHDALERHPDAGGIAHFVTR